MGRARTSMCSVGGEQSLCEGNPPTNTGCSRVSPFSPIKPLHLLFSAVCTHDRHPLLYISTSSPSPFLPILYAVGGCTLCMGLSTWLADHTSTSIRITLSRDSFLLAFSFPTHSQIKSGRLEGGKARMDGSLFYSKYIPTGSVERGTG